MGLRKGYVSVDVGAVVQILQVCPCVNFGCLYVCVAIYCSMCLCVNKCVLVFCGWCWLPEADYHPHPSVLFLPVSPPVWKLCGHPLDCLTAEACRTLLSSYPSVLLIFFPLCRVSSFLHFSVERWRGRECERERRGEQGGRAEIWELVEGGDGGMEHWRCGAAVELLSVGV